MGHRPRRLTRCSVPGHGDRCEVSTEQSHFYPRVTENLIAMEYEVDADWVDVTDRIVDVEIEPGRPDAEG